jgi:hypothetical protein
MLWSFDAGASMPNSFPGLNSGYKWIGGTPAPRLYFISREARLFRKSFLLSGILVFYGFNPLK